jgi:hypothetical protein
MPKSRIFSSMDVLRLSQPLAASHIHDRRSKKDNRRKNENYVQHVGLLSLFNLVNMCSKAYNLLP